MIRPRFARHAVSWATAATLVVGLAGCGSPAPAPSRLPGSAATAAVANSAPTQADPVRSVQRAAVAVLGRGWGWLLEAGTALYTGTHWDPAFGWPVVDAVRTGHAGALVALLRDADIAESDFECSMTAGFTQHNSGTVFSIDPRVAPLMAQARFEVATIAADHNTNVGIEPVSETVRLFRANGIAAVDGGASLTQALRPAVIDDSHWWAGVVGILIPDPPNSRRDLFAWWPRHASGWLRSSTGPANSGFRPVD